MYFVRWHLRTLAELSFLLLTVNSLVLYLVGTAESGTLQSGRARIALFAIVNLFTLATAALFRPLCARGVRVATEPGEALARPTEWWWAVEYVCALLKVVHFMLLDHVLVSAGIPRFSHEYITYLKLIYIVLVLQAILSNSQYYVGQWPKNRASRESLHRLLAFLFGDLLHIDSESSRRNSVNRGDPHHATFCRRYPSSGFQLGRA
jgi:hypothetical protein